MIQKNYKIIINRVNIEERTSSQSQQLKNHYRQLSVTFGNLLFYRERSFSLHFLCIFQEIRKVQLRTIDFIRECGRHHSNNYWNEEIVVTNKHYHYYIHDTLTGTHTTHSLVSNQQLTTTSHLIFTSQLTDSTIQIWSTKNSNTYFDLIDSSFIDLFSLIVFFLPFFSSSLSFIVFILRRKMIYWIKKRIHTIHSSSIIYNTITTIKLLWIEPTRRDL